MSQLKVTDINPLVAGKKVVINLDMGYKYLKLQLKRSFTAAQCLNPVFKKNGKPFASGWASLADLEDINTHFSRPQTAGYTTIYLERPELTDTEDRQATGWGTEDVRTLSVEFTLDAAVVAPTLEVEASVAPNEPFGLVTMYEVADINLPAVGKNVVNKLPIGNGSVTAYFFKKTTHDITDLVLSRTINGAKTRAIESSKEFLELEQTQCAMRPRVPVTATVTVLDFILGGKLGTAFQTANLVMDGQQVPVERVALDVTVATAEVMTVVTESIGFFNA